MYLLSIRCIYECKWIKRSLMSISYHLQMVERLTNDTLFQNHHQFFFPSSRTSRFYERPSLQWHHLLLSRRIPATVGIPGLSLHTLCSKSNPDGICSVAAGTSSALAQERVQPLSCTPTTVPNSTGAATRNLSFLMLCAQERAMHGTHLGLSCTQP